MNWRGGGSKQARTWCGCGIPAHSAAGFGHPLLCWLQGWRARRSPCCGALLDLSSGRYVGTLRPNMRPGQPAVRRQQAKAQAQPAQAQPGPSDGQHPCSPLQLLQGCIAGVNCGPYAKRPQFFSAEMYCSRSTVRRIENFLRRRAARQQNKSPRALCALMGLLLHCGTHLRACHHPAAVVGCPGVRHRSSFKCGATLGKYKRRKCSGRWRQPLNECNTDTCVHMRACVAFIQWSTHASLYLAPAFQVATGSLSPIWCLHCDPNGTTL